MMNIVNTPSFDHFDEHSESTPYGGLEISIRVYYGTRKNVLQINGGGIIYIKQRAHVQTETQSQTYGGAFVSFSFVGFGVLVGD